MNKELNPQKYVQIVNQANKEALEEATKLLKEAGENNFIVSEYDEDGGFDEMFEAMSENEVPVSVFGVGLTDEGTICVAAFVNNVGYGFCEEDFPQEWTDVSELDAKCYPYLYRFVAQHIEQTISKEEADQIAEEYWS